MNAELIAAKALVDAALRKIGSSGSNKGSPGLESMYAEAYAALCKLDRGQRLPRKKYR